MKMIKYLIFILIFSSCSRLKYIVKQGVGQSRLLGQARPNSEFLNSPKTPEDHKNKILLIQKYKSFFYQYFNRGPTAIYDKTTMLKQEAVTYLVIRSKHDEIKALEEYFPLVGRFPYLGFFDFEDAKKYSEEAQRRGEISYLRPVYAYSTLGHFTDPILSSFFYFDELELADLVFHELFHTIFFIKDEVDLNEAMAEHFSEELSEIYFSSDHKKSMIIKERRSVDKKINQLILTSAKKIEALFLSQCPCDKDKSQNILENYLKKDFYPALLALCPEVSKVYEGECKMTDREWNNATFAASLTYEEKQEGIEAYFLNKKGDLKSFLDILEKKYHDYGKAKLDITFADYLLRP